MTDDQLLLASTYLDGDLDPAERARAESDPEVMAEVARLGDVRERLRAVDRPNPARREAAIASALAGAEPSTAVAPLRRRRTWLPAAAAAAVVAVAIAGVAVVANRSGGDDTDTALVSVTATPRAANEAASDRATLGAAATTAAAAAPATAAGSATTTAGTSASKAPAAAPAPSAVVLASPAALAAFATQNAVAHLGAATTPPTCTGGRYVGRADYGRGGQTIPVEVFVQGREALALDARTCAEVARATLP